MYLMPFLLHVLSCQDKKKQRISILETKVTYDMTLLISKIA